MYLPAVSICNKDVKNNLINATAFLNKKVSYC